MHHRRNSSLAVIDRGLVPSLSPSSSPSALGQTASTGSEKPSLLTPVQESHQPFSSAMAVVRRRIRPVAIVLAFAAFLLLLLMGGVFNTGGGSSSSRVPGDSEFYGKNNNNRPYPPSMAPGRIPPNGAADIKKPVINKVNNPYKDVVSSTPSTATGSALKLTLAEELGAVVAYLTSLGANARIPDSIDPAHPIDAELILGFNTRSARASSEVAELVRETWEINPVVLFGEARQPMTKTLRRVLESLHISPKPVQIFLDERDDSKVLTPLIERLTGGTTFPILLIGGQYQGSLDDILVMQTSDELQKRLTAAGAKVSAGKKMKKARR